MDKRSHSGFIYLTSTCLGLSSLTLVEWMYCGLHMVSDPDPTILVCVSQRVGPLHYVIRSPVSNMGMWGSVKSQMRTVYKSKHLKIRYSVIWKYVTYYSTFWWDVTSQRSQKIKLVKFALKREHNCKGP